jgi:hypothetical protein
MIRAVRGQQRGLRWQLKNLLVIATIMVAKKAGLANKQANTQQPDERQTEV